MGKPVSASEKQLAMEKIYDDDINAFLGFDHSHMGYWLPDNADDFSEAQREYVRQLVDLLQLQAGQRVLDVGGGQGGTAIWLARTYGVEVTIVDITAAMIEQAIAKVDQAGLADRITCVHADLLDFAPDQPFDAVIAVEALYHMPDQPAVFAQLALHLVEGGRLAASTYVCDMRFRMLANLYLMFTVGDTNIASEDDYREAASAAGLQMDDSLDVTDFVIPRSSDVLANDPYRERIKEYHRIHYGRIVTWAIPLFTLWHDRVTKKHGLRLLFLRGTKAPPE